MPLRVERVRAYFDAKPVWAVLLYGSAARGTMNAWSDVDIAILAENPLGYEELGDYGAALEAIFERPVDVVDLRHASTVLKGHIMEDAKSIVVHNAEAWSAFKARAILEWLDYKPLYNAALKLNMERMGLIPVSRPPSICSEPERARTAEPKMYSMDTLRDEDRTKARGGVKRERSDDEETG